jgi:uncharacterized protein YgbK (DUF1537 family)
MEGSRRMIGVIADDLTGAAELGAVGLRLGLKAEIVRSGQPGSAAELVCVDTDSRSCARAEAARRAAAAAALLRSAGARWIYKKVDSVLRGNVTAEVEAVMLQLGFNRALLLPANPSLGRVIRDGEYFIQGRPIHRTEFARDPEYPRRTAQVLRLVDAPEHFLLRLANGERTVSANTLLIGQTDSTELVHQWAAARQPECLMVGGSEFFGALLGAEFPGAAPVSSENINFSEGLELFVCGTSSRSVQLLVKAAKAARTPVFGLPKEQAWGMSFPTGVSQAISQRAVTGFKNSRRIILQVGLPPVGNLAVARGLSKHLVDVAESVLGQVSVKNIFAEGGATSAELVRRMKWPRLQVVCEWAPGVATLAVAGPGQASQWLTIKPGSYAWPEGWTHASGFGK